MRLVSTWLRHPEVWRFVGFVSSIVAMLCYALSSSFNNLFGNWNFTKLFVYVVLSVIICLATLFAKVWQNSPSLRFRAHVAFFALTITSVYSFFFDKAVNGKPDVYSLVSCVAFAMMSLSLSRQIHCGFEVDLLYFFLGALIVQLMKINKMLGMVGICFSYLLIILRSSLDAPLENDYLGLQVQDQNHLAIQVDSQQPSTDDPVIAPQFMASIGEVHPITSKALSNIIFCFQSQELLEPILQEYLKGADGAGTWSSFSEEMVSIIEQLKTSLIANSKDYEDPAMVRLFMMNNRRFIENEMRVLECESHLYKEWVQNNTAKIQQDLKNSWKKVLDHLKLDKESLTLKVDAESMIERLTLF